MFFSARAEKNQKTRRGISLSPIFGNTPFKRPGQRGAAAPFLDGSPRGRGRKDGGRSGQTHPYPGGAMGTSPPTQGWGWRAVPVRLDGGRLIAAPTHRWETVCVPICAGNSRNAVGAADLHRSVEPCRISPRPVGAGPRPARSPCYPMGQGHLNRIGSPSVRRGGYQPPAF